MRDEARTKKELIDELQSLKKANSRLKRQLKNAEEKNRLFFANSSIPTFITSLDGKKVIDANTKAIELAGYSSKQEFLRNFVTGERDADPRSKEDLFSELESNGEVNSKEYRFFKKDGTSLWVDFNAKKYRPKKWLVVEGIDITKRKKFESNLKKAQRELKKRVKEQTKKLEHTRDFWENIFLTSVEGCMVVDVQGNITMVNPAMEELLGYSRDELVGKSALMVRPEGKEHQAKGEEFIERLFEDGYVRELERKWQKKDGSLIDVEINGALLRDEAGNHIGGVGSFRNITEHKEKDQMLEESMEFLESVFKASVDGIIVADQEGRITMVNDSVEKMFGYTGDELLGMHTAELAIQDESYQREGAEIIARLLDEGTVTGIERKWVRKDGCVSNLEMNIALLSQKDGTFEGAVGVIRDVSERKRIEQALRESERKYRELVQKSNSVILRMDLHGNITFFNKFAQNFFGFTEKEIIGKNVVGTIVPERESTGRDLEFMIKDIGVHPEKYKVNVNENMRSNGEKVWLSWTNNIVVDEEGQKKELLCFGNDITKLRHAEENLQETRDFLDNIIESSLDSIVITDTKGIIRRVNRAFLELIGCEDEGQVNGKHIMEFAPRERGIYKSTTGEKIEIGDDFFKNTNEWMSALRTEGKINTLETFHINADKAVIPVEDTVSYIYNKDGVRLGTVGIIRDITERKQTSRLLQQQKHDLEERFKELACLFSVSKLCQDISIKQNNLLQRLAESIPLGWQYQEITCVRIIFGDQEFISKGFRETPWRQSADILISGEKNGSVEVFCLEARPESYKGPFLQEEENLLEAIAGEIGNAIMIRQAQDKIGSYQNQLRSLSLQLTLIEERERRKFATFIHDQIGQALFSAKIQLEALEQAVPHEDGQKSVNKITSLLEQVIKDSRDLTFEVGAPILYQLGIEAALRGLVEKANKSGEVSATFSSDEIIKSLDEDMSIFLFRAVQELLNNIVKHAQAHNVEVSIFSKGGQTCVSVKDDGIGFTYSEPDQFMAEDYRFGLFSIKERLVHFGGQLLVEAGLGQGTCVTLIVPQKNN
jgi:PAS domain S-box-containing protein